MGEPGLGSKAILPVSTENMTTVLRDVIWVKQMASKILSSAEEYDYSPHVGYRKTIAVEKPHHTKLLLNVVPPLIGPDVLLHP